MSPILMTMKKTFGSEMSDEYLYNDIGYTYVSMHRRVLEYDPRNTNNPIILDYFNTIDIERDNSTIYYSLLEAERLRAHNSNITLPISFLSIWHQFSMSWVDIIHQMIFIDNSYATFVGEYKNVIENVILYDNITDKEALVYRYHKTGDTMFHIASKLWLYRKYMESKSGSININIDKELKYILECYEELEWYFGEDRKYCILYLMDFKNNTIVDTLTEFGTKLVSNDV